MQTTHAVLNKSWKQHPTKQQLNTTYIPFCKIFNKVKQDMMDTAEEVGMKL